MAEILRNFDDLSVVPHSGQSDGYFVVIKQKSIQPSVIQDEMVLQAYFVRLRNKISVVRFELLAWKTTSLNNNITDSFTFPQLQHDILISSGISVPWCF